MTSWGRSARADSVFRRLPDTRARLRVWIDGAAAEAPAGDSVAALLLAAGVVPSRRSAVSGAPRAPYCMMGVCFDCLVTIDGVDNRQACLVPVRDGMRIETMHGKRRLER